MRLSGGPVGIIIALSLEHPLGAIERRVGADRAIGGVAELRSGHQARGAMHEMFDQPVLSELA